MWLWPNLVAVLEPENLCQGVPPMRDASEGDCLTHSDCLRSVVVHVDLRGTGRVWKARRNTNAELQQINVLQQYFLRKIDSFSCWQRVCSGIASKLVCKYASEYIVCKNASFCLCSCLFYCKNLTTREKYLKAYTKAAGCCCFWYKMRNQFLSILIFPPC